MHKNKKRLKKQQSTNIKRDIFATAVVVIVALAIAKVASDWINKLPIMQPHYAKPSEIGLENGMPLLIAYCSCLLLMVVGGYLVGKRMDAEGVL